MRDPRRWLLVVVAAAAVLSFFVMGRGPVEKYPHADCLAHAQCQSSERCLVLPKSDGFATMGLCSDVCEADLECPARQRCQAYREAAGYLVPEGAKGAGEVVVKVCVPGARDD